MRPGGSRTPKKVGSMGFLMGIYGGLVGFPWEIMWVDGIYLRNTKFNWGYVKNRFIMGLQMGYNQQLM